MAFHHLLDLIMKTPFSLLRFAPLNLKSRHIQEPAVNVNYGIETAPLEVSLFQCGRHAFVLTDPASTVRRGLLFKVCRRCGEVVVLNEN